MTDWSAVVKKLERLSRELKFVRAARHLSQRKVDVYLEPPYIKDLWGVVHRNGDRAIIKIDPDLPADKVLEVFLHEVAHCKLHFYQFLPSENHKLPARSHRITDKAAFQKQAEPQEIEAEKLAAAWLAYAEQQAPGGTVRAKLEALLKWPV